MLEGMGMTGEVQTGPSPAHWSLAVGLLVLTGTLLGISTNLAKVATGNGLSAYAFLTWSLVGATGLLLLRAAQRGLRLPLTRRTIEYYAVAAFVTVAASNLIFFSAVPIVGASFVALAIAFPPLLTYLGALCLGIERFSTMRAFGVVLALSGAGILAVLKLSAPDASLYWIVLTLFGPVLLAIGNIYRSLRWPPGASPEGLAPGMLVAAASMLLCAALLPAFDLGLPITPQALGLTAAQACVFAAQFLSLFALQRAGGPVLLSLLGAVGAITGVPAAIYLLGETSPAGLVPASVLIAGGIALVAWGGVRQRRD